MLDNLNNYRAMVIAHRLKNYGLLCIFLFLGGSSCGCGASDELVQYRFQYEKCCEDMAFEYRRGRCDRADFHHMRYYFEKLVGTMTAGELRGLLGEPRVVVPQDCYYGQALSCIYGLDALNVENWDADDKYDKHDRVLHYGEDGPPDHWIADESFNLFFVMKEDVVIAMWCLFP